MRHHARTAVGGIAAVLLALLVAPMAMLPAPAQARTESASTCAAGVVTVRGETSRYRWSALVKARANWRARVRATPGLGTPYANWSRAAASEERCASGPAGTVCTLSGRPCR